VRQAAAAPVAAGTSLEVAARRATRAGIEIEDMTF
jgi:hypothetical protein